MGKAPSAEFGRNPNTNAVIDFDQGYEIWYDVGPVIGSQSNLAGLGAAGVVDFHDGATAGEPAHVFIEALQAPAAIRFPLPFLPWPKNRGARKMYEFSGIKIRYRIADAADEIFVKLWEVPRDNTAGAIVKHSWSGGGTDFTRDNTWRVLLDETYTTEIDLDTNFYYFSVDFTTVGPTSDAKLGEMRAQIRHFALV